MSFEIINNNFTFLESRKIKNKLDAHMEIIIIC